MADDWQYSMEDDFAAETRESLRYDIKRLLSAQQGITSEKITERKVSFLVVKPDRMVDF